MPTVPNVQLAVNDDKIQVFWEVDPTNVCEFWNLYQDTSDPSMGSEALALGNIPNVADAYYSKRHVTVTISRPNVNTVPVYLRIKGVVGGVEDLAYTSAITYVPSVREIDPMISQKIYGFDPDTGKGLWRPVKVEKDKDPSIAGVLDVTP